jgi:hypothetical protein
MKLLLALGQDNDLVPRCNNLILLEYFHANIHIKSDEKDLNLSFFYSYKRDVLFELFNDYDDVADDLLLTLFESA